MTKSKAHRFHANGRPRASSGTPQKTNTRADNVDLTKTDPWAYQAKKAKQGPSNDPATSASTPTPLSLAFSGKHGSAMRPSTTITAPQDLRQNPTWLQQRMAAIRDNANRQPSFSSAVRLSDNEGTPTPDQNGSKNKKKSKKDKSKQDSAKATVIHDPAEEAKRQEKKKKVKEEMKQQTARAIEGLHAMRADYTTATANGSQMGKSEVEEAAARKPRKRKHAAEEANVIKCGIDDAEAFHRRVRTEAHAVKRLRETIPPSRLGRVAQVLEQQEKGKPTEMAVLLNAARETILDLASAQILRTEQVSASLDANLLRIVKAQEERLGRLEGMTKTEASAAAAAIVSQENKSTENADDTSSAGSDDNGDEDPTTLLPDVNGKRTVAEAMNDSSSSSGSDEDSDEEEDNEEFEAAKPGVVRGSKKIAPEAAKPHEFCKTQ